MCCSIHELTSHCTHWMQHSVQRSFSVSYQLTLYFVIVAANAKDAFWLMYWRRSWPCRVSGLGSPYSPRWRHQTEHSGHCIRYNVQHNLSARITQFVHPTVETHSADLVTCSIWCWSNNLEFIKNYYLVQFISKTACCVSKLWHFITSKELQMASHAQFYFQINTIRLAKKQTQKSKTFCTWYDSFESNKYWWIINLPNAAKWFHIKTTPCLEEKLFDAKGFYNIKPFHDFMISCVIQIMVQRHYLLKWTQCFCDTRCMMHINEHISLRVN